MLQVLEALHRGYTVGKQHGMRTPVEDLGDALEGLLACGVPNLKFKHGLITTVLVHLEEETSEFDSDGHLVILAELIGGDSVHEAGLADARIADDDQLK